MSSTRMSTRTATGAQPLPRAAAPSLSSLASGRRAVPLARLRAHPHPCARPPVRRSIVEFATADDLEYAIRRLDGSRLDGHRIEVVRENERGPPAGYVDDRGQGPSYDGGGGYGRDDGYGRGGSDHYARRDDRYDRYDRYDRDDRRRDDRGFDERPRDEYVRERPRREFRE